MIIFMMVLRSEVQSNVSKLQLGPAATTKKTIFIKIAFRNGPAIKN